MKNLEIARIFYEIADILEMQGVEFKPRAYRKAAKSIETLTQDVEEYYKKGKLEDIPCVGENIANKIEEILKTGRLKYYEKLKKQVPKHLTELMQIPGMGAKRANVLHEKLKISSIKQLEKAAKKHKIAGLFGFGEKSEEDILKGIELIKAGKERMLLGMALPIAKDIESRLKKLKEVKKVELAGSLRRRKETVGDLDILVISKKPAKVMDFFTSMKDVKRILAKGPTKSSVLLKSGLQIDLRVVPEKSFGAALQYFIGNKYHNIKLRQIAIKKGYKLSEYGLFNKKTSKLVEGRNEKNIYKKLGMKWMEPELRENKGEIQAAIKGKLPKLVPYGSIKGDLHVHSKYSDGNNTIQEIALEAKKLGYEYIGIADHSKSQIIAHGMDEERLLKQIQEIQKVNKRIKGIRVISGIEVDIKADGDLDYPDKLMKRFEIVTAAIHSGFKSSEKKMTKRITRAMENKHIDILDHPTGRLINKRLAYDVNLKEIFRIAKQRNIFLEINAHPARLDLNDVNVKAAIDSGCKLAIGTDAHSLNNLKFMELGVATARRGWAEKKHILNTKSLKELSKHFERIKL